MNLNYVVTNPIISIDIDPFFVVLSLARFTCFLLVLVPLPGSIDRLSTAEIRRSSSCFVHLLARAGDLISVRSSPDNSFCFQLIVRARKHVALFFFLFFLLVACLLIVVVHAVSMLRIFTVISNVPSIEWCYLSLAPSGLSDDDELHILSWRTNEIEMAMNSASKC